jgi:hypothetical protein
MALDYSKLSDDELDALAKNDYSRLSDATLKALAEEPAPAPAANAITQPEPSLGDVAMNQAGVAAVRPVAGAVAAQAGDAYKLAKIAGQVTPNIVGEFLSTPFKSAKDLASAYIAGHPMAGKVLDMPLKAMPGAALRGLGTALAAPESAFMMQYQMAAYEQDKIRANPTAPQYATNPYAQAYRGEYKTQGAAGAANRRNAISNAPSGYQPTAEEAQNIMQSGDQRLMNIYGGQDRLTQLIRMKAAKKVLGQP